MTKFDSLYFEFAKLNSKQSKDGRLKVGATFTRDDRILSHGWNGTPPGDDNECQDENGVTKLTTLHAEENAILRAARDGESLNGSTLYCTHVPCPACSRKIFMVGIKRLVYGENYRNMEGIEYLKSKGIEVVRIGD